MAQKFADKHGVTGQKRAGLELQTDEWPMASWDNEPFDRSKQQPQRSLRCITNTDNASESHANIKCSGCLTSSIEGANEWSMFRHADGDYGPGGPKAHWLLGSYPLRVGDTFHVNFDMSEFDQNDPEDQKVMNEYGMFSPPFDDATRLT